MLQYIAPATGLLFTLENILWINIGVFVGAVFAAIPGLSVILCVILFLPVTYTMTAIPGMMFLLGIYCAGGYGGSVSAILINTGRGHLVNENDLAEALNQGIIAAYGADVLCVEPALPNNPLLTAKNAFLTPHIAWASTEARKRLLEICTDNIKAFLNGTPQNIVE